MKRFTILGQNVELKSAAEKNNLLEGLFLKQFLELYVEWNFCVKILHKRGQCGNRDLQNQIGGC